eukprot:CAMPEP_0117558670 /NCGR_PEP_ID=MMETSP0784-20121206/52961_1 /TAXON_ID=39447 /ORGANISM="" /LENGTH=101 /DNA_ID=CAMNT_0005356017 /DNA_START=44 /DNA_END=349 /DNA_ORIENTATION=+
MWLSASRSGAPLHRTAARATDSTAVENVANVAAWRGDARQTVDADLFLTAPVEFRQALLRVERRIRHVSPEEKIYPFFSIDLVAASAAIEFHNRRPAKLLP